MKNSKLSLFAAIPAFILCFIARFLQLAGGTDMRTGFLNNDNGIFINFAFYGLVVICFIAIILLCVLDRKRGSEYFSKPHAPLVDSGAVMLGFPLLVAGALAVYEGYLQLSAHTPSAVLMFVGFIFGALMVILAFVILYKKEIGAGIGFCMVLPAIYYTARGICVFIERMAVVTVPEYLIDCLSIIGFGVYFMLLAKLLSGNEGKRTRTALSAVGITTAVMTLSSAFATIAADIFDPYGVSERIVSNAVNAENARQAFLSQGKFGYHMAYTSWTDVLMAVGVILTLVVLYTAKKAETSEIQETEAAEVSEEATEE